MDAVGVGLIFAGVQALCALLSFFRVDYRILLRTGAKLTLPTPREKIMAILAFGSIVYAVFAWFNRPVDFPEFDAPQTTLVHEWSASFPNAGSNGTCQMTIDGSRLWTYRSSHKLAIGCLVYDGVGDVLDAPYLEPSALYDIKNGQKFLVAKWSAGFFKHMQDVNGAGNTVFLFLVPVGTTPGQFTTLRQARALGVRIIASTTSRPSSVRR